MGKYATYRLRGGGQVLHSALPSPPAPLLFTDAGRLWANSACGSNLDGESELWVSEDGLTGWDYVASKDWAASEDWGSLAEFEPDYYRCRDLGNGLDYVGIGEWSNVVRCEV